MLFPCWQRNLRFVSSSMVRKQKRLRRVVSLETLEGRLCPSTLAAGATLTQPDVAAQARMSAAYGQLPLSFEANQGQTDARVNFLSQGSGYTLFLTPTEAVMSLQQPASNQGANLHSAPGDVLRMQLVGANPAPAVVGLDPQAEKTNYFVGSDPAQWHTNIANFGKVQYQDVYAGVNLVYYGNQQQLEYDFVLAPGADPKAIQLGFQGAEGIALDSQGDLVLHTGGGDVIEHAPVLYQESNGVRQAVSGHYVLEGNGQVGFAVGAYNPSQTLVIDPVYSLVYSTYLGGNKASTAGYGIAVDASGDAYVTGWTQSTKFPTTAGAFQRSGPSDPENFGFVTKFNAAGSALAYSTFIGSAIPSGIAVDAAGNAYLAGLTVGGLPTKNALQPNFGGASDAFVMKLNATGSALVYSTYLGGSGDDAATGIAVDGSGDAYVIGNASSTNFPTTPGSVQPVKGAAGLGIVAKLNPIGSALVYSTYLDSAATVYGEGIAVDGSHNAYVTGWVFGSTSEDVLVAKLNSTGSAFVYFDHLGASSAIGYHIAVDGAGNAYVTGLTQSNDFPTTAGAFQTTSGGGDDAFVTELNAAGTALVYSTYLGGSGNENNFGSVSTPLGGIAVDSSGKIYVTGDTTSTNFPTKNALQATYGGGDRDAFVAEIDPSQAGAASLVYSTYLGGSDQDVSLGIAVDGSGNAYVTGKTFSADFPTKDALQPEINPPPSKHNEISDAFVTKIDPPAEVKQSSRPASLDKLALVFVNSISPAALVVSFARTGVKPAFALSIGDFGLQANPLVLVPMSGTSALPRSSSAPEAPQEEAVGPTPAQHLKQWLKAGPTSIEVMDEVFARSDWLPDLLG